MTSTRITVPSFYFDEIMYDSTAGGWVQADDSTPAQPPWLPPGVGFFFFNPNRFPTNFTFIGQVVPAPGNTNCFTQAAGFLLLGSMIPASVSELAISLLSPLSSSFAQGLVVFANARTTLVSAGATGQNTLIAGPAGSYYFGLLTAPPGTTDPGQFSFAGVYATNSGTAGLFGSLSSTTAVPGWAPATTRSFLVAGWSASLGPGWNVGTSNG